MEGHEEATPSGVNWELIILLATLALFWWAVIRWIVGG